MSSDNIMILIGAALVFTVVYFLNRHSITNFKYSFFSKPTLFIGMLCSGCLYGALHFYSQGYWAVLTWSAAAMGVAMIGVLIRINCVQTNLRYGLCGSVIQIPLLIVGSVAALPLLAVALFFKISPALAGPPLPGKTQFQKDQEWYFDQRNPHGFHKKR